MKYFILNWHMKYDWSKIFNKTTNFHAYIFLMMSMLMFAVLVMLPMMVLSVLMMLPVLLVSAVLMMLPMMMLPMLMMLSVLMVSLIALWCYLLYAHLFVCLLCNALHHVLPSNDLDLCCASCSYAIYTSLHVPLSSNRSEPICC